MMLATLEYENQTKENPAPDWLIDGISDLERLHCDLVKGLFHGDTVQASRREMEYFYKVNWLITLVGGEYGSR